MHLWRILTLCLGILVSVVLPATAQQPSARREINMGAFIGELLSAKVDPTQQQLALWLPYDFFRESANSVPESNAKEAEKEIAQFKNYQTLLVECLANGKDGKFVQGADAIRARATLRGANGVEIAPLATIPDGVAQSVAVMQQALARFSGGNAENFHILLFPAAGKDGKPLINTQKRESMELVLKADKSFSEALFTWRTPFDALSEKITCPKCHEVLSAKWFFCPWCSTKIGE